MARLDVGIQFFAAGVDPEVHWYLDGVYIEETYVSEDFFWNYDVTIEDTKIIFYSYTADETLTYDYGVKIESGSVKYFKSGAETGAERGWGYYVYAISSQTTTPTITVNGTAVSSVIVNGKECNKVVCNGVTVFEKQSTETAVGGWLFNSVLSAPTSAFSYDIDFTSDGNEYDTIIYLFSATTPIGLCYGTTSSQVYTDTTSTWTDEMFKTITITGGTDATNSEFITWLKANATKSN